MGLQTPERSMFSFQFKTFESKGTYVVGIADTKLKGSANHRTLAEHPNSYLSFQNDFTYLHSVKFSSLLGTETLDYFALSTC